MTTGHQKAIPYVDPLTIPRSAPAARLMRADVRWFALGVIVAVVVNLHGLVRLTAMPSLIPGQLNAVLAPLGFVAVVLWLVSRIFVGQILGRGDLSAVVAMTVGGALIAFVGLGGLPYSTGSTPQKLLRDVAFLGLIVGLAAMVARSLNEGQLDRRDFATGLLLTGGIMFPALGLLLFEAAYEGRHGGFLLTPTMMANASLLTVVIAYRCAVNRLLLMSATAITAIVILESGTRAALLLFAGFLAFVVARPIFRRSGLLVAMSLLIVAAAAAVGAPVLLEQLATADPDAARVVSTSDLETGSLATRLIWAQQLLAELPKSGFVGGFGAGEAEALVGTLPHLDVLRFWFDYTLLYPLLVAVVLWRTILGGRRFRHLPRDARWFAAYMVGSILLMTTHNPFQDVAMTTLIVIACGVATVEGPVRPSAPVDSRG